MVDTKFFSSKFKRG